MEPHMIGDLRLVQQMGEEVARFIESPGWQRASARIRARIFDDCMKGATLAIREDARSEGRAYERLLEALTEIQHEGIFARQALEDLDEDEESDGE
jgi:hypothetical protein